MKQRILVVDDEPQIREMLSMYFDHKDALFHALSLSIPEAKSKCGPVGRAGFIMLKKAAGSADESIVETGQATTSGITCMEGYVRNFAAFQSHRLKSEHLSSWDRFNDLENTARGPRLERLAEVRHTVVTRGKALIANANYPDKKIIRQISRLLAVKLRP